MKTSKIISLKETVEASQVALSVFKAQFEQQVSEVSKDLKQTQEQIKEQKGLSFNIILGCVFVSCLFVLGLIFDSRTQMIQYEEKYSETQKELSDIKLNNVALDRQIEKLNKKTEDLQMSILELKVRK